MPGVPVKATCEGGHDVEGEAESPEMALPEVRADIHRRKKIKRQRGDKQVNKARREALEKLATQIEELKSEVESLRDEEQEYLDNMPESLQGSDKAQVAESAVSDLEDALNSMGDAMDSVGNATSG